MSPHAPFSAADLADIDERLYSRASAVIAMQEVHAGNHDPRAIALRHDCDNGHSLPVAMAMAAWEAERGYRSTYFVLHTSPYWLESAFRLMLERIAELGHEIGIHNNALAETSETGGSAVEMLSEAIERLRGWGFTVRGTVAHGDTRCYNRYGRVAFVNDQMFTECRRPKYGVGEAMVEHVPLATFGLDYDANWLPRGACLSDSGGTWSMPFDQLAADFPLDSQLHVLMHPDWWGEAFAAQQVAA